MLYFLHNTVIWGSTKGYRRSRVEDQALQGYTKFTEGRSNRNRQRLRSHAKHGCAKKRWRHNFDVDDDENVGPNDHADASAVAALAAATAAVVCSPPSVMDWC